MKVVITPTSFDKFNNQSKNLLKDAGFEIIINNRKRAYSQQKLIEELKDADAIILGNEIINEEVLKHAPKLKLISKYGVGINNIDCNACQKREIIIKNTSNANTQAVAEHTIALILSLNNQLKTSDNQIRKDEFSKNYRHQLSSKKVGIIGFGSIGKRVCELLEHWGCELWVYARDSQVLPDHIKRSTLDDIFRECKIISLHLSLTTETKNLIDSKLLKQMQQETILVNTSRAELIQKEDLKSILEENKEIYYGCDVYYQEPKVEEFLIESPNTLLSPHSAASTIQANMEMSYQSAVNVINYFKEIGELE